MGLYTKKKKKKKKEKKNRTVEKIPHWPYLDALYPY